ncbi:CBS domain-containing protein [Syntrophobacter fumaroxidans]|uniref:CBS domain containing membrane protein n=1 Tax=Syntrophobacter fumaroxidans (strain DSM 10017 / MPOB) TaxID=335543 RepID=A0LKD2_SYNFM|nr:CBS domain-containing protein [Syntrophobacter fumaroxidans]ABK17884.1 CBS domain containing membrane protein [Syntrophobacter fumaroxidans MPOB]
MLRVADIMTRDVISVSPQTEIVQAAKLLLDKHINGLPVIDDRGNLVGILCQSDLIAQQKRFPLPSVFNLLDSFIPLTSPSRFEKEVQKISAVTVGEAMTREPVTVSPDTTIEEVARLMVNKNLHTLPVVDGNKLIGIIGKEDVLRTLLPSDK